MGTRRYANLEDNLRAPQSTNFIEVSGQGSWLGSPPQYQRLSGKIFGHGAIYPGVCLQSSANPEDSQRLGLSRFVEIPWEMSKLIGLEI